MLAWNGLLTLVAVKIDPFFILFAPFAGYFISYFAVPLVTGFMLWRTFREEGQETPPSRAKQRRRALILVFLFACAFLGARAEIFLLYGRDGQLRIFQVGPGHS